MPQAVIFLLLLSASLPLWAQSADRVEFEVASIKPSPPPDGHGVTVFCNGGPGTKDPTLFTCQNMSLSNLVCQAYKIAYYQLVAPDWGRPPMFHINARVPEGATKEQFQVMLQKLLADRFKLVVHRETRDFQKYELVVAKNGPKFKEAGEPPAPKDDARGPTPMHLDKDGFPTLSGPGMGMMGGRARVYQPAYTMAMLAGMLGGQLHSPVTDSTGLTGKYEINLYWVTTDTVRAVSPDAPAPEAEAGPPLLRAVQDQLGLRLESKKGPVDFLVVDHAEKAPIEN